MRKIAFNPDFDSGTPKVVQVFKEIKMNKKTGGKKAPRDTNTNGDRD